MYYVEEDDVETVDVEGVPSPILEDFAPPQQGEQTVISEHGEDGEGGYRGVRKF